MTWDNLNRSDGVKIEEQESENNFSKIFILYGSDGLGIAIIQPGEDFDLYSSDEYIIALQEWAESII